MGGNPIADEKGDEFKKEILILLMHELPELRKINGDGWDEELLADVKQTMIDRAKEAERLRLEAEGKPPPEEGAEGEGEAEEGDAD